MTLDKEKRQQSYRQSGHYVWGGIKDDCKPDVIEDLILYIDRKIPENPLKNLIGKYDVEIDRIYAVNGLNKHPMGSLVEALSEVYEVKEGDYDYLYDKKRPGHKIKFAKGIRNIADTMKGEQLGNIIGCAFVPSIFGDRNLARCRRPPIKHGNNILVYYSDEIKVYSCPIVNEDDTLVNRDACVPIEKYDAILKKFTSMRQQMGKSKLEQFEISISQDPEDILAKSTGQFWTSCEKVDCEYDLGGEECGWCDDISCNNLIAYIKPKGAKKQAARTMIRWCKEEGKDTYQPIIYPFYGDPALYDGFEDELIKIFKDKGYYDFKKPYEDVICESSCEYSGSLDEKTAKTVINGDVVSITSTWTDNTYPQLYIT